MAKRSWRALLCVLLALGCLCACGDQEKTATSVISEVSSSLPGAVRDEESSSEPIRSEASSSASSSASSEASSSEPHAGTARLSKTRMEIAGSLYAEPSPEEPIASLEAGWELNVQPTEDRLWYAAVLEDGTKGYVYGECLGVGDGTDFPGVSGSLAQSSLETALAELRSQLPEGKYWNHMGMEDVDFGTETPWLVTDIPCEHSTYGQLYCNYYSGKMESLFSYGPLCECLGFASFLSDRVFGEDAPFYIFYEPSLLRVGDHIRFLEYEHSMTVAEVSGEGVVVAEVNADYEDCLISWSRLLSWDYLDEYLWDSEYISRYPLCPDGQGGFMPWPEDSLPQDSESWE